MRSAISLVIVVWLVIGFLAAWQRGYLTDSEQSCASVGTTLVTVVSGPLNYVGTNPEVDCPPVPQPSE
ncbi:hypothetical protein [Actinorugispora endophytica]|uniref:Uncharacterized protein n=1 Tax=Actinorugispora endophytica TaxID=1605990 RepID=A0A4R6VAV5_9ACTN|nr:hypothetical protein [Actinorugispora endophytica]TDQ53777.1 hypothetical protein EV190_103228 [Actinorugispora endophytica]